MGDVFSGVGDLISPITGKPTSDDRQKYMDLMGGYIDLTGDQYNDLKDFMNEQLGLGRDQLDATNEYLRGLLEEGAAGREISKMALAPSLEMLAMAKDYYNQTAPIRGGVFGRLGDFLSGNLDPTADPRYGYGKSQAEDQYQVGRQNLLDTLPTGGALQAGFAGLEGSRARSLLDVVNQITTDDWNKAYGVATGSPTQTFAGMSGGIGGIQGTGNSITGNVASMGGMASGLLNSGTGTMNSMLGAAQSPLGALGLYGQGVGGYGSYISQQQSAANSLLGSLGMGAGMYLGGKPGKTKAGG